MKPRRTVGLGICGATLIAMAVAPQADARLSAKFKVLSLSGSTTMERHVAYEPSPYGDTCEFTQTERITFRSTKPLTAYAFTSRAHGRGRVEWSPKRNFVGNLVEMEIPGEMTVSRTAAYQQSVRVDPDTGEVSYGCYAETGPSGEPPTDCAAERTFPVTVRFGGTSDLEHTTYVSAYPETRDLRALDDACYVAYVGAADDPRLFSRAALFNKRQKRVKDADRIQEPAFDHATDDEAVSGTIVDTVAGELKRKKLPKAK